MEPERFGSSEALLNRLKEMGDDMEAVKIMVVDDLPVAGPGGPPLLLKNVCGLIKTVSGKPLVLHRDDLQMLLNEGLLQRLRIPIELLPQEDR